MHAIKTTTGLVETSLFEAFEEGGLLANSNSQSYMVKTDIDVNLARQAFLSGGAATEIAIFSINTLNQNYRYADSGNIGAAIDLAELSELGHLAELCGRNKLAVHKPNQLASAVAPCLTFDRNAHLAVYTGEQPCGNPGHSSILFRPAHGEETIDASVIEQVIAPIILRYESEGSSVFDAVGGAAIRRLQAPDEILMFCVDCSASMRRATDFAEVNDTDDWSAPSQSPDAQSLVAGEFYNRTSFDDMKERLCEYEGFDDMCAIVGDTSERNRRYVINKVLSILRMMLSSEIIKKAETLENRRSHGRGYYHVRQQITELDRKLGKLKGFWAGLETHEEPVCDFLIYRATSSSRDISQRWTWSLGDDVPASTTTNANIPSLEADITDLPHQLRCPISHTLMEDAVTASDGHTYSQVAISQWFSIKRSSPMTGLALQDTSLTSNQVTCDEALRWRNGNSITTNREDSDEQPSKRPRSKKLEITFESRVISPSATLKDLYKLAFRGLAGRYVRFQLSTEQYGALSPQPTTTVSSRLINDGHKIAIRIPEDDPSTNLPAAA
ncbi:hypothetical protein LTR37_006923 [Vermiconidia calcicola]|uniref:Uncharacterized protein n=1 Tax=Vermiconidia calcicola TaxID=1690605 RepID=A0ACC3NGH2_9PEZI|nr:hypothetical protein LTR37_006923 [Vermiconidia calcicola]